MEFLVIACAMLQKELERVRDKAAFMTKNSYDLVYWSAQLHNHPQKMRQAVKKLLSSAQNYDAVLLVPGSCGRALNGLQCPLKLVLPKADDCISLLLPDGRKEKGVFYLTPAWLQGESSFFAQYEKMANKKGSETAHYYLRKMLNEYKALCFLSQTVDEVEKYQEPLQKLNRLFKLPLTITEASTKLIEDLFWGKWGQDFVIIKPGEEIPF
ncbi:MAG: DUF1638 domain-containing protein [Bacillota bacterium]|jgi:predicted esterase YcpF (UPF0227 family)